MKPWMWLVLAGIGGYVLYSRTKLPVIVVDDMPVAPVDEVEGGLSEEQVFTGQIYFGKDGKWRDSNGNLLTDPKYSIMPVPASDSMTTKEWFTV